MQSLTKQNQTTIWKRTELNYFGSFRSDFIIWFVFGSIFDEPIGFGSIYSNLKLNQIESDSAQL